MTFMDEVPEVSDPDLSGWVIAKWALLGPAVRDRRRDRRLTQADLAELAGVSRGWLVRFEHGLDNAEPSTVFRVLRALDLDLVLRPHATTEEEDLLNEALGG